MEVALYNKDPIFKQVQTSFMLTILWQSIAELLKIIMH